MQYRDYFCKSIQFAGYRYFKIYLPKFCQSLINVSHLNNFLVMFRSHVQFFKRQGVDENYEAVDQKKKTLKAE